MNNKNNTKKKVIAVILAILALAIALLFLLKGCQKEEPVHTHSYKINEEGTWICKDDNDILSNTDKPYVAILENNQPKDILAIDSLSKTKINLGNGTIYKDGNNIYYSGNNAQTVIIKTQKVDDKQKDKDNLVINAPNDTVYHYGSSTVISLDAVATNSFHEYGKVDLITLTKARVVLENKSDVKEIYLDINNSNYSYETTIIALKENVELPRLTRDAVSLEEGEVKTLAIVQKLKDEVKTETNTETNEVIETVLEVQAADDDYVKIENVRKSNDELIIEAFLSPNPDEQDKTLTQTQSTSTITLEEAKEGSSHPASHNTFVPKQEKVTEVVKSVETPKEEQKQEETKPAVTPTKKEEVKPEVTPTDDDKPSTPTHTHSYGNVVCLDDTYHGKKCSCGDAIEKEKHLYSYVAISDSQHKGTCSCGSTVTGNHSYGSDNICDVCGYVENSVARIDDNYYMTVGDAFNAVSKNKTIVILKDYSYSSSPSSLYSTKVSYTLDLNGHSLDLNDSSLGLRILKGQTVIIKDESGSGKLKNKQCVIYMDDGSNLIIDGGHICGTIKDVVSIYGYGNLTINNGVIDSGTNYSVMIGNHTNDNTPASFTLTGGTLNGGLYINGQDIENNDINISGGTIYKMNYLAGYSTTTITGGYFEGDSCIYAKAGTIKLLGGTFKATGNKRPFNHNDSGASSTGDAIIIESCSYPGGDPITHIVKNIDVTSDFGSKVACYVYYKSTDEMLPRIFIDCDEYNYYKIVEQPESIDEGIKVKSWKIYDEQDVLIQTDIQKEDTFYTNSPWNNGLGTKGQKNCSLEALLKGGTGSSIATGEGMKLRCDVVLSENIVSPISVSKGDNMYFYLCDHTITGGTISFEKNIIIYSDTDNLESMFAGGSVVKTDNGDGIFTYTYTKN